MVEIVREAYPDHTQFDSKDPHFDPKSKQVRFIFLIEYPLLGHFIKVYLPKKSQSQS